MPERRSRSNWTRPPSSGRRGPSAPSSGSRRRRGRRHRRSRRRRRAASSRGRCSPAAACSPTSTTCRRSSSTRWTPASEGRPGSRSAGGSRGSADGRQVLVVTHLPQIASFADRHIRVEKEEGTATVRPLPTPSGSTSSRGCSPGSRAARAPSPTPRSSWRRIRIARRLRSLTARRPSGLGCATTARRLPSSVSPRARAGTYPGAGSAGSASQEGAHTSTSKTRGSRRWSNRRGREAGIARVDRRTKDLVPRASPATSR